MTEEQIEIEVERRMDAIDREWIKPGCKWTQGEYETRLAAVDAWAMAQQRKAWIASVTGRSA